MLCMNIVVIWDQLGQEPLRFLQTLLDAFPCDAVRQGAPVVVCGFLP